MDDSARGGDNSAEVGVARTAKANDFAADSTFLCVEFEGNKVSVEELVVGSCV
jgi:hypothetical protein